MEWTPTRIPTRLFQQIREVIDKHQELGYTNEHEFIRAALREKIEKVYNKQENTEKEV